MVGTANRYKAGECKQMTNLIVSASMDISTLLTWTFQSAKIVTEFTKRVMKKDARTYTIKILKGDKVVSESRTKSMRRFLSNCRLVQFKDLAKYVYIKVVYGTKKDNNGQMTEFKNEGTYTNKKDLLQAAQAFCNEK